jgi:hypothetical protein
MRIAPTKPKKSRPLGPVKVRHEPPTLDEAIAAARDIADDVESQAEIAAELMGVPVEEARARVLATRVAAQKAGPDIVSGGRRVVVVERRPAIRRPVRPMSLPPRG